MCAGLNPSFVISRYIVLTYKQSRGSHEPASLTWLFIQSLRSSKSRFWKKLFYSFVWQKTKWITRNCISKDRAVNIKRTNKTTQKTKYWATRIKQKKSDLGRVSSSCSTSGTCHLFCRNAIKIWLKIKRQIGLVPIWYPHIYEAANGKTNLLEQFWQNIFKCWPLTRPLKKCFEISHDAPSKQPIENKQRVWRSNFNSNMTSFFRFVNKRAIYRLGIISLAHAPVHVTDFPVVNVHEFDSINCVRHCPQT